MEPAFAALSDLGLELQQSPNLTEIRLPARLKIGSAIALAFIGAIGLLMWAGFAAAAVFTRQSSAIGLWIIATTAALALLYGLSRVVSWLRYGVKVSVTPDRFIVKHHRATMEAPLELYLKQVRFDETRRAIVVSGGKRRMKIGTALSPEARHAVVEFLTEVIAGYAGGEIAADRETSEPRAALPWAREVTSEAGASGSSPPTAEQADPDPIEISVLALCQRFLEFDLGDVHLAPTIPQPVFAVAAQSCLNLQEDETLLAIVGVKTEGAPMLGCALTTKRIHWPGKMRSSLVAGPPRCHSLDYASLPATIKGLRLGWRIDLRQGRRFALQGNNPLRDALIQFLGAARSMARGEAAVWESPAKDRVKARWAWPRVAAANTEARALQAEIRTFESRTTVASRPLVTPVIALACVVVFIAMVARGVSAFTPTGPELVAWGANFGPSVVFDHQVWRLFTAMFLHIGLVHIFVNMLCLVTAGPVVERFFGHSSFAALYVIAGIGGSIASLWAHPVQIGAGASGAIFGIFGGLLGFLAIRYRDVPPAVLKPMRVGAVAFIGYNTIFGLIIPGIDMAAHLGGLAAGFACGLLMTLVSPAHAGQARRLAPALARVAVSAVVAAVLAGIGTKGIDAARAGILADPKIGPLINSRLDAAPAFKAFYRAADPILEEFDRVGTGIDQFIADLEKGGVPEAKITQALDRLKAECTALGARIATIPAQNEELQAIRNLFVSAQSHQLKMLTAIDRFIATGEQSFVSGPDGFQSAAQAYVKDLTQTGALRDAYIKTHELQLLPNKGSR